MTTVQELNDKMDAASAAADVERQEVVDALKKFKDEIDALKAQVATGSPASQADLDALGTKVDVMTAKVQAVITPADIA